MPMNNSFTKQWVVQNTGIGAWPIGCILLCIDGSMTDILEVTKQSVLKDETYIFCVPLRALIVADRARWECQILRMPRVVGVLHGWCFLACYIRLRT